MGCSNSRYILSDFYFKKMFDPASTGLGKSKTIFSLIMFDFQIIKPSRLINKVISTVFD